MSKGIYVRDNRKGFSAIEFLVGLAVIGMLVLAVYLYRNRPAEPTQQDQSDTIPTSEQYKQDRELSPTIEPVPTDSTDPNLIDKVDDASNISDEPTDLDRIEADLNEPRVDVSPEEYYY